LAKKPPKRIDSPLIRSVKVDWEDVEDPEVYPFNIPAIKSIQNLPLDPKITIFIGENGSGKSTLLEGIAIAVGFSAEGGFLSHRASTEDTHSKLHEFLTVYRGLNRPSPQSFFLRAETLYNIATYSKHVDPTPGVLSQLHNVSHGEGFLKALSYIQKEALVILDEPESALSPQRQLALIIRLNQMIKNNCQIIIASHSPILLAFPNALLYEFSEQGINQVTYKETEHYRITRDFLANPETFLHHLLQANP
jgi:predicted ATPase